MGVEVTSEWQKRRDERRFYFDRRTAGYRSPQVPPEGPQEPAGAPHGMALLPEDAERAEKVDSCWSNLLLLHSGHSGLRDPRTMASKRLPQS